nr:MAG: hypothetical protein [Bacteriophage sp.]
MAVTIVVPGSKGKSVVYQGKTYVLAENAGRERICVGYMGDDRLCVPREYCAQVADPEAPERILEMWWITNSEFPDCDFCGTIEDNSFDVCTAEIEGIIECEND